MGCLQSFTVQDGKGQLIGAGKERCANYISCCPLRTDVYENEEFSGEPKWTLQGPSACWLQLCMKWPCRDPFDFEAVENATGRSVGKVSNVPNGCFKMFF